MNENTNEIGTVFYDDFVELWQDINGKQKSENWDEKYKLGSQLLNQSALANHQFVTIFDTLKQKIAFSSDNIRTVLGQNFSQEYYENHPVLFWIRNGHPTQVWFLMKLSLFFKSKVQKHFLEMPQKANAVWYFHNLRFHNSLSHIGIRGESLEISKNGAMRLQMSAMQKINTLIKDKDTWWAEVKINDTIYYHYRPETNKFLLGRLFSERELEIIRLVMEGADTKEIAEQLFISTYTVETHRKNIIKKTGVKDLSSLIYILKLYDGLKST